MHTRTNSKKAESKFPPPPKYKNGIFVLFLPPDPPFSGFPSTKSRFLCFFGLRNPRFRAFRAQNRGFCAFLAFGTPVFGRFEHKIGVFVLFWPSEPLFSGLSSTKSRFLCSSRGTSGSGKRKRDLPANHRARFKNSNAS